MVRDGRFDAGRRRWLAGVAETTALAVWPGVGVSADAAVATVAAAPAAAAELDGLVARFGALPANGEVRRVFAAGPPAGVLLAAVAPQKLLGWPMKLPAQARAWMGEPLADLPYLGRLAGRGSTMPLEALLELQPDLVLDSGTVDATYLSGTERLHRQTGLPCVLVQGGLADSARQLRAVGALLGESARVERLAAFADEVLRLAAQVTRDVSAEQRPRVYLARGVAGLETARIGAINAEVIELAGGRNVAVESGRGGLMRVSLEQLLRWDPAVILTQDAGFASSVRHDRDWRSVRAVREGRVLLAPALPFGWLDGPPGMNRLMGLRWLLQRLHPDHVVWRTASSLDDMVQSFYQLFYGKALSAAQRRELLPA